MGRDPVKYFWRWAGPVNGNSQSHCFRRLDARRQGEMKYRSLCNQFEAKRIGTQAVERPGISFRCDRCNELEMSYRNWEEPGPVTG